ncbi:potassium transporter [Paratrimastix pyriformis]|uniref:Potassium transporter n=1 Tax=Paratrimastix pyriformis TaxID=342808 RepID=A0ABQ8UDX7_9EUKA|nr:potassium transporter [Paratrimastix pyriformis]
MPVRKTATQRVKSFFQRFFSYFWLHFAYIVITSGLFAIWIYFAEQDNPNITVTFIDAWFFTTSAISNTGLMTFDLSHATLQTQILMVVLFQLGSGVMLTLAPLIARRYFFRKAFNSLTVEALFPELAAEAVAAPETLEQSSENTSLLAGPQATTASPEPAYHWTPELAAEPYLSMTYSRYLVDPSGGDVQGAMYIRAPPSSESSTTSGSSTHRRKKNKPLYLYNLEYLAMGKLVWLVLVYMIAVYVIAALILWIHFITDPYSLQVIASQPNPVSPLWFAIFHTISAFNNAGVSTLADSVELFQHDPVVLFTLASLILLGNTLFPIVLRCMIWVIKQSGYVPASPHSVPSTPRGDYVPPFSTSATPTVNTNPGAALLAPLAAQPAVSYAPRPVGATSFLPSTPASPASSRSGPPPSPGSPQPHPSGGNPTDSLAALPAPSPGAQTEQAKQLRIYRYLMKHSRECFTHLFSSVETRMLLIFWLLMNGVQFAFFLILDWNNPEMAKLSPWERIMGVHLPAPYSPPPCPHRSLQIMGVHLPAPYSPPPCPHRSLQIMASIFQCVSTRAAGFTCINVALLNQGVLFLTCILMIIGPYPFIYTLRKSSIPVSVATDLPPTTGASSNAQRWRRAIKIVGSMLRLQQDSTGFRDLLWLFTSLFLICSIENDLLQKDLRVTIFSAIFEVSSAYGNVGMSLGFPTVTSSFASILSPASKAVVLVMMLLGKHRDLPSSIDRAINFDTLDENRMGPSP